MIHPKRAVRAAPIEGEEEVAIQQKWPFASGKFRKAARELKRKVLAETPRSTFQ